MSRALKGLPGVADVKVDLANRQATVTHSGTEIGAMKAAVDDAGYDVVSVQ